MDHQLLILLFAIILDMFFGDPDWIWRKISHPVVYFGALISKLDQHLNRISYSRIKRHRLGILAVVIMLALTFALAVGLQYVFNEIGFFGLVAEIVIVAILIAQKSMSDHIDRIIAKLSSGDLAGAQQAVGTIVGRDTSQMDGSEITRSSIESLAENFSDGVVAPIFWYALMGLPGIFAYKMLNTADSMIGHKNLEYEDFGWTAAKLDDVVNWLPARISALLISISALISQGFRSFKNSVSVVINDAGLHRSPNAGWPETAMAGALNIVLSGPRKYGDDIHNEPYLNSAGRLELSFIDLKAARKLFWLSCILEAIFIVLILMFRVLA